MADAADARPAAALSKSGRKKRMQIERGFSLPSGKPPAGKTWDPKLQVWVDQQGNQLTVEEQKAESKRKKNQKKNQKKKLRRALNKGFDAANEETEMVDQEDQEEAEAASVEESSPAERLTALAEAAAVEDERASFNDAILKAEPPRRWLDNGTARVSLGETHADSLYRFLRLSRHARNASLGKLVVGGRTYSGYFDYSQTTAVESGRKHNAQQQKKHTLILDDMVHACAHFPGLEALIRSARRCLRARVRACV